VIAIPPELAPLVPDLTTIAVSNTPDGRITFQLTIAGPQTFAPLTAFGIFFNIDKNVLTGDEIANYQTLPAKSAISILFNLDKNGATGDQGFETAVTHAVDLAGQSRLVFERFEESRFSLVEVPTSSVSGTFSAGVFTVQVPRTELQNTRTFEVGIYAVVFGEKVSEVAGDVAPDQGLWTYDLVGLPAPSLSASTLLPSPRRPVAGRQFSVSAAVTQSDTGAAVSAGGVTCNVRIGKVRARARGSLRGESARCTMAVPRTARGKTLSGTLTVRSAGASVTKRFSYKVI
jgi:hypothetical protein